MYINQVIRLIMARKGISNVQMAKIIGKGRPNDVSARLTAGANMSVSTASEMLIPLGYIVAVVPIDGEGEEYFIDPPVKKK